MMRFHKIYELDCVLVGGVESLELASLLPFVLLLLYLKEVFVSVYVRCTLLYTYIQELRAIFIGHLCFKSVLIKQE